MLYENTNLQRAFRVSESACAADVSKESLFLTRENILEDSWDTLKRLILSFAKQVKNWTVTGHYTLPCLRRAKSSELTV